MALGQILGGLGAAGSLFGGLSANKASKELMRKQRDIAGQQLGLFREAQPYYGQILNQYANRAGLGGGVQQTGENQFRLGAAQRPGGLGSNWGSVEDQLRLQQVEEEIKRRQKMAQDRLLFQGRRMGLNEGALGANLARTQTAADRDLANFQRQQAIGAGQEEERRLANLTGLLGLGFGQGGVAQSVLGQQAGNYGQQASGMFGNLGSILQQMEYQKMLRQMGQNPDLRSGNYGGGLGGL